MVLCQAQPNMFSVMCTDDTFGIPGEQFLDGTVVGAMKAADALYPPPGKKNDLDMLQQLMKLFGSDH